MRNPTDYSEEIRWKIVKLYLSDSTWSHRRLQSEVLKQPAPARGGGYIAKEILRYQGIPDDSLKGVFTRVEKIEDLLNQLSNSLVPELTAQMIGSWFFESLNNTRAYLLSWNPNLFDWKTLKQEINEYKEKGVLIRRWGCGSNKSIKVGDRIFLIKLGPNLPRGIMASGYVKSGSTLGAHWSGEEDKNGLFVEISFDVILDPDVEAERFISTKKLTTDIVLMKQSWSIASSGIGIKAETLERLENLWFDNFKSMIQSSWSSQSNLTFKEGKNIERISKTYERNPKAREACLNHFGYNCLACDLNFRERYGDIGKEFIHVHHIIPISKRNGEYTPNPIKDLIPLCPNCHSMIHRIYSETPLDELKRVLK